MQSRSLDPKTILDNRIYRSGFTCKSRDKQLNNSEVTSKTRSSWRFALISWAQVMILVSSSCSLSESVLKICVSPVSCGIFTNHQKTVFLKLHCRSESCRPGFMTSCQSESSSLFLHSLTDSETTLVSSLVLFLTSDMNDQNKWVKLSKRQRWQLHIRSAFIIISSTWQKINYRDSLKAQSTHISLIHI